METFTDVQHLKRYFSFHSFWERRKALSPKWSKSTVRIQSRREVKDIVVMMVSEGPGHSLHNRPGTASQISAERTGLPEARLRRK